MVEPDRPQLTIRRMRFEDTHSACVIHIAFLRHKWLCERASFLCLYVHCRSCLFILLMIASYNGDNDVRGRPVS
jgi:hypothetical protein